MLISQLPPAVLQTLAAVFGLLVVASVAVRVMKRRTPERDYGELAARIRTWWIMVGVFTAAVFLNRAVSLLFFMLISFLAMKEYFSLIPTRRADRRVLFWAYVAIPIQYYWIGTGWHELFLIFVPVYGFLFVPLRLVLSHQTEGFLRSAASIHWGLMVTLFCISHAAGLLVLPPPTENAPPLAADAIVGPGLLLYLVVLTQGNDVAQYLWGKTLGRHKIAPVVSPNKTWEGFAGGVATTTLIGTLLGPLLTPLDWPWSLLAGVLIGVAGFVGDVTISALKRDLGIKDTGQLLPGHGGLLDRIDSLTYTAPLFYHLVNYRLY